MRQYSGQLFPLILLGSLAGLTYWLQAGAGDAGPAAVRELRHEPDAIAENFEVRRFDATGQVKYRLSAPRLVHYPDDDSTDISNPRLIAYRATAEPLIVTARHAHVTQHGETVYLKDEVQIERQAAPGRPAMRATMPDLTVQPEAEVAFTQSPVEITQGNSWVKGIGAHLDHKTATFELQSQVRGQIIRSRAQP